MHIFVLYPRDRFYKVEKSKKIIYFHKKDAILSILKIRTI